ncbi:precorrin-3B C(17)-methyltransferase [Ectopseudomonas alcaliphila]|uniref:precorrin-3B C(17)-methyltransferase n=1 Tax=Ectopseudomonas alcaliphila TaxID=101564 RepID=UPI0027837AC4|nr:MULTISPECIES: precorrin-3B C(17)-methyltransferase [Pseudomonas]MDP9939202.1 cobalt-precorrin 5A hydrolase/precorrin-3B C17-methyltransferase [Pseudomonas sp. 3400]MDR7011425.1 cobalt-precorrin 5A hydrolase/precorrin-3B C17-methyltransferase [Pseudomonas alcaliphila]
MNIVILGASALATAHHLKALYPQALIHGLRGRADGAERHYDDFGDHLRALYREGQPLLVLCAAGIVIRSLAPLLAEKGSEPPVLALAEDGSAVVPLLGGLAGVNRLAREIAAHLGVTPAITTSGELRFGTCLLEPPTGYALADLQQGKRFVSDLLGGESVRIEGQAPWLDDAQLPVDKAASRVIHITAEQRPPRTSELLIHPRCAAALIERPDADLPTRLQQALSDAKLAPQALACLLADKHWMANAELHEAAAGLNLPLRFIHSTSALPIEHHAGDGLRLLLGEQPLDIERLGQRRGRLSVVGLGPGAAEHMTPAVRRALDEAEDLLGYDTYVKMAGPLRADQCLHPSDNREELQRAAHAFELAAAGRRVVMISSGDPGVFAMAAAVMEALESPQDEAWHGVELEVLPGVSAALATAAKAGAPLGHDFCLISLSDNLKPWAVIEKRLQHAAAADLAMAFYNPISRARPWQLGRALELLRQHREPQTLVVLGRDIGRPAEALRTLTLGELTPEMVDMRTLVIIGSSQTRRFPRADGGEWVYTPRWYPES